MHYKNGSDENSVPFVSRLFQNMGKTDRVTASLRDSDVQEGVSAGSMSSIHTHLQSANIWRRSIRWTTEVEYTIPHPDGDVTAFDTNSGGDAKLTRNKVELEFVGCCAYRPTSSVVFRRTSETPSNNMDFNTTRFSSVRIMNAKRFYYETERSSWVFNLVVAWEGNTKQDAEESLKKYYVYVETVDNRKTTSNPKYSAASFMEKTLDVLSVEGKRQVITFDD